MKTTQKAPDMLKEYDFSSGIQDKYSKRYRKGTDVVVINLDFTAQQEGYQAAEIKDWMKKK